jgi:hypothetical protein
MYISKKSCRENKVQIVMSNTLFPQVTVFSAIQEEGIKVPEFML